MKYGCHVGNLTGEDRGRIISSKFKENKARTCLEGGKNIYIYMKEIDGYANGNIPTGKTSKYLDVLTLTTAFVMQIKYLQKE
jgi:hypothetical protein